MVDTLITRHVIEGPTDADRWTTTLTLGSETGGVFEANVAVIDGFTALFNGQGPGVTGIGGWLSPAVGVDKVTSYEINSVTGRKQTRVATSVDIVGTGNTTTGVPSASIVVFWIGSLREDHGRVRMYLPPLTTDAVDGGIPLEGAMDSVADGVTAMFLSVAATAFDIGWNLGQGNGFQPASGAMIPSRFSVRRSREFPAIGAGSTPAVRFVP